MFIPNKPGKLALRSIYVTSIVSTVIFALIYGIIEHTLLTSSLGVSILTYPLNVQLVGNLYIYHTLMLVLAILISFNQFLDGILFGSSAVKRQALLWGTGNIFNFIWLEDMFYFVTFLEWPKDVMTPVDMSFYGVVWWYPIMLLCAVVMYTLATRAAKT